jgi:DNA-binding MarR family transcriptional regulator
MSTDRLLQILLETYLSEIRSDHPDLTFRQLAIVLVVYQTSEPQTVRGLAKHMSIAKPTISRALDRLSEINLVRREPDPRDSRSIWVGRTLDGAALVERLGVTMTGAANRRGAEKGGG